MQIIKPKRAAHTYIQTLKGSQERVFPLLCPVREADWIDGWDPSLVVSESGVAERDCAFITGNGAEAAIWTITRHEPESGFVEMLKITPGVTVGRISIQLHPIAKGCQAEIRYSHTSLGPAGDEFVEGFTEAFYRGFMQAWEARMNHFLEHGVALRST